MAVADIVAARNLRADVSLCKLAGGSAARFRGIEGKVFNYNGLPCFGTTFVDFKIRRFLIL